MAAEENINFLDLACVFKIGDDTTLERFGSTINASVFDAANISGSLKQKGLIDFTPYYPGPNTVILTEAGKQLKKDADAKSVVPIDALDEEVLKQMSGGKRYPVELQNTLNIRPLDLAFRLYKLFKQSLVSYELKNGNVEVMLTEQGFLKAKTPQVAQAPTASQPALTQQQPQLLPGQTAPAAQSNPANPTQAAGQAVPGQPPLKKPISKRLIILLLGTLVLVAAVAVLYLHFILQLI
jgi:hypothetical protein